jgi:hypothetical protein
MRPRLPARSIDDFKIDADCYTVDFEISARFEKFATEIERLSLLGIGAYGFLLTNLAISGGHSTAYMDHLKANRELLEIGVIAFALAAGLSLWSNYLSTKCLGCQLDIVRMFSRLESQRWNLQEQTINRAFVEDRQRTQKRIFSWNEWVLGCATGSLGLGAAAVAFTFARVIFKTQ